MRDMAHSICLIKLCQVTMRKSFDFLFLTALNLNDVDVLIIFRSSLYWIIGW